MNAKMDRYIHEVHLNLNVRGLGISPTLAINELSRRLIKEGRRVFRLGLGQSPFPIPEPVTQTLRDNAHQKDYLSVHGLEELRQAITVYFHHRHGLTTDWQNILIGPGSKELMFLLQLAYYGDLIIPIPSWVSYAPQAHIVGRPVRWINTSRDNGWLITPEDLEQICYHDPTKPRIVALNYPNNPTGKTYSEEMLKELAEISRKYHIILLSDEIYGELDFSGNYSSVARYYPEGTIISSGLSKWCGAGGWRLGLFAFPYELHWLRKGMAAVASETFTSTSAPIQYAAVQAFQGGEWLETYLENSRMILSALAEYCRRQLGQAGVMVEKADGGFYLFPDFSQAENLLAKKRIHSSEAFCNGLLNETGVAILPGSAFGLDSNDILARLAFVDFDGAQALQALSDLGPDGAIDEAFLTTNCERVTTGVNRICDWLTA